MSGESSGWRKEAWALSLIPYQLAEYGFCSTSGFSFFIFKMKVIILISLIESLGDSEEIKGVKVPWRVESTLNVMSLLMQRQPFSDGFVRSSAKGLLKRLNLFITQFFQ